MIIAAYIVASAVVAALVTLVTTALVQYIRADS